MYSNETIIILFLLTIAVGFWLFFTIKSAYDEASKPKIQRKEEAINTANNLLLKYKCILMAKSIDEFMTLPQNTIFIFVVDENNLVITAQTNPKTEFLLNYNQIIKFQENNIPNTISAIAGQHRIPIKNEVMERTLHLEYLNKSNIITACNFELDTTIQTMAFNEIAKQGEDIFEYVNARIPKQDNTVIL